MKSEISQKRSEIASSSLKRGSFFIVLPLDSMASSSRTRRVSSGGGSSVSSGEVFGCFNTKILCECKHPSQYRISHSLKNPNRPYLRCPKSIGSQCRFFRWVDELDSGDIRKLLEPEVEAPEERQKLWLGECVRSNNAEELKEKIIALKNTKKKLKKELICSRIIIFLLLFIVLSSKLG